ncbi:PLP-dependent aspartate aminotransferase family protein [Lactobacillaceae bacterium 24-114]
MKKFNTRLIHIPDELYTHAVSVPIYKAKTYAYPSVTGEVKYDYSRSGNPTRCTLEGQLADLEGGLQGFAFSSGMAAIHAALAIFKPGDHIIVGDQIYGGTFRLLHQFFERWGLTVTAVDTRDLVAVEKAILPTTKAIYFEPITNPLLQVTSVAKIAKLAKAHHLLTIVDNTFLSPYLLKPLQFGADIVIHSATKYLSGHSDVSAGAVIVNSHHLADKIYFVQNSIGSILSPEDSNEIMRGIKTLSLRIDRQVENVKQIISFLLEESGVSKIYYPGIQGFAGYEELQQQAKEAGGVFSFELQSNIDAVKFINHLKIFKIAVSLGAVESLVELPSKMSHAELSPDEQRAAGIKPNLIRLAVGIEDVTDLIADIRQALKQATNVQGVTSHV